MLVVSHEIIFVGNEAVLLCVTVKERVRACVTTI